MAEETKDFVIKDRRASAEGASEETSAAEAEETQKQTVSNGDQAPEETPGADEEPFQMPQINFPTFVLSMNASALVHLGAIDDPATGTKTKNLPMAKQTIDILSMLEEKTKGNLTGDEEKMLKGILYDLKMIYVREKG